MPISAMRLSPMIRIFFLFIILLPPCVEAFGSKTVIARSISSSSSSSSRLYGQGYRELKTDYPESKPATYDLLFANPLELGATGFVRPLLKQTQLEKRKLQVVYDANKHGYDAKAFHDRVDGKGASIVLARVGLHWFGGYNPRGWASLGGARSSVASFLFYKTLFGWQKLRAKNNGGGACSRDEYNMGIYFGAEGLVMPLQGPNDKSVASRLGFYFDAGPGGRSTTLPSSVTAKLDELKVISGVYAKGEIIPNSGGVSELGFY